MTKDDAFETWYMNPDIAGALEYRDAFNAGY